MLSLSQRPLTASHADHRLFVGREEELDQVLQSLQLKLNVYVTGPPGIGRTSFLRQVQRQKTDSFYVRLNTANDVDDALHELSRILSDRDSHYGHPALREPIQEPDLLEQTAGSPFERLQAIGGLLPSWVQPVVMVDDLTAEVHHQIFGRMRDELWELPIQWVVAGTDPYLHPPADAFFESVVELRLLEKEMIRGLLLGRAESGNADEKSVLRELADSIADAVAPCTPRRALSIARDAMISNDLQGVSVWLEGMSLNRKWLTESGERILNALTMYGPTHAGDERLLTEVGVSRNRVVQILGELEDEGLVTARRVGRQKHYSPFSKPSIPKEEQAVEPVGVDSAEEGPW